MDANLAAVIAAQDAVILGRRSYDEWAEFWPGSEIEPFATFINGVAKYVATSTPLDREWANATAVDGDLVEFVRDLKDRPGGDIGVHASISVAQALLAAGVVDELRLVIAPSDRRQRTKAARRVCRRFGSNRSDARPHRPAICSSTTASSRPSSEQLEPVDHAKGGSQPGAEDTGVNHNRTGHGSHHRSRACRVTGDLPYWCAGRLSGWPPRGHRRAVRAGGAPRPRRRGRACRVPRYRASRSAPRPRPSLPARRPRAGCGGP